MSSISTSSTVQDKKEGGGVIISPSTFDHDIIVTPPPPAAPPPLPVANIERRCKIRSFYWKPIPDEHIQQRGAPNLWTLAKHSDKHKFLIDIKTIEDLFGHTDRHTVTTNSNKTNRVHSSLSEQNNKISILDRKRSMNVAIFLKCFKKSIQTLIDYIVHGNSGAFGAERLRELNKLLPNTHEVKKLHSYKGDKTNLNTVDSFMYQLTLLPRFDLRVEAMLLKEEFSVLCSSLKQDVFTIRSAIRELLSCVELHSVLHLVLQAGNIINTDGYGGNAVGFKLSSLLSLAETKSNKQGMNLLHFVALEAKKKDDQLLKFPHKLQYVESAARVNVDILGIELDNLTRRIEILQQNIQNDTQLMQQLDTFLQCAVVSLKDVSVCHSLLVTEGVEMIDFFCEDRETFKLDECFYIFYHFCSKFTKAVQENEEHAVRAESHLKRVKSSEGKQPSWARQQLVGRVLGSRCSSEINVQTAVKWEGLIELLNAQPPSFHNSLEEFGLHRQRRRVSGSNMNITDTHSPSDTHSLSLCMPVQVETHTVFPELQNFPFKTFFCGYHGNDPTDISSSDATNNEEIPYHGTGKHPDMNRHIEMTSDPAKVTVEVDAKLVLGVESGVDRTIEMINKQCETQNEELNSNFGFKQKLDVSPAAAKTNANSSNPPELKSTRKSTNQELDCKITKITNKSNNATCENVKSFRKLALKKTIVSPDPSPSSLKLKPLHPVQTLTEKQSMRKVFSVRSTKPQPLTHSQSVKILTPTTSASSCTTAPVHTSLTSKVSFIQKSIVKKPTIYQKSAPKEKICRATYLHPQESHSHTRKTMPHFACSTVASTTRSSATISNTHLSQKDVSTSPKAQIHTAPCRASQLSTPSRSANKDVKNVKVIPVRPAWR